MILNPLKKFISNNKTRIKHKNNDKQRDGAKGNSFLLNKLRHNKPLITPNIPANKKNNAKLSKPRIIEIIAINLTSPKPNPSLFLIYLKPTIKEKLMAKPSIKEIRL